MTVEQLLQEALARSPEDRGRLIDALLQSFEPDAELTEGERAAAWTAELDRRLRDLDEGRAQAIPYEEAMAQVRARLART